ncbi:MAG: hypothetical protein LBH74_08265 [Nitrososphaerota archaeon]|jgi:hypothetical protein|nr:hypothetical protein [Nitrososphaerota archaeon]
MKINIEIDKLILHGFSPQEQTTIQNMIITELTNNLKNKDNAALFKNTPNKALTYNVNTLKINTTTNPQKIGHEIAYAIKNYNKV